MAIKLNKYSRNICKSIVSVPTHYRSFLSKGFMKRLWMLRKCFRLSWTLDVQLEDHLFIYCNKVVYPLLMLTKIIQSKDDGTCGCYPFDPGLDEVVQVVNNSLLPSVHGRWEECFYAASSCCTHYMHVDEDQDSNNTGKPILINFSSSYHIDGISTLHSVLVTAMTSLQLTKI